MVSQELILAIKNELSRSATSTMDAIFLNMLKSDLEYGHFDTNRVDVVRRKYKIKPEQKRLKRWVK